jgi:hypothetical protein
MSWKKSTRSGANGCVEVNVALPDVGVRDSKDPASPVISFAPESWRTFVEHVRTGRFDRPAN